MLTLPWEVGINPAWEEEGGTVVERWGVGGRAGRMRAGQQRGQEERREVDGPGQTKVSAATACLPPSPPSTHNTPINEQTNKQNKQTNKRAHSTEHLLGWDERGPSPPPPTQD